MATDGQVAFGRIRFDARTGELARGRSQVRLTPRAAAVLAALAESAEQLVTKQELFDRVWGGRAVGDDALTSCIQELRHALGDDARRPRYIETKHRRGYRLMVPLASARERPGPAPRTLVGRAHEMGELARSFEQALAGRRQMMFVGGEPGIGKSALVDAFLAQLATEHSVRIAHGQCLDHHGVGEPYLPLMEALMRLAGASDGAFVKRILRSDAPSWLAQMPSLWTKAERGALEARGRPTRDRMLRELTQAIETMSAHTPLVFVLEDIHWSDASTRDWLAHVARRPEPARLMTIATLRPADPMAIRAGLPAVVSELALHGQCRDIALNPLDLRAIEVYLEARLGDDGGAARSREMAPLLLERTGGNPLFLTSIVNQLAQRDSATRTPAAIGSIPHDVRRFIDRQIDELDERDRSLLTAASVIRREFATAAVAAALQIDVEQVEADCARLARQGVFIVRSGSTASPASSASSSWPDGTRTELYSFRHDLYREMLYDRLSATRRALSHARVGRRLEAAWSGQLDAIAAELAEHCDRGNEPARAIPHHRRAAAKALRRAANAEAIRHLRSALDAIGHIADEGERTAVEVGLLISLGAAFMATRGFGAPEVLDVYSRAAALCEGLGERADIFPALWGQWLFRWGRSEVDTAWRLCQRLLALAEKSGDALLKLQAHHAAWATSFGRGELADVHVHARAGFALYDAKIHQSTASSYGNHDANVCARYFSTLSLALAGENRRARAMMDSALATARSLNDPFTLALALSFASIMAQMLGDAALAIRYAEAGRQMAIEHDLTMPKAWSTGVLGWCTAEAGDPARGIILLTEAIAALQAAYSPHFLSYLLGLLADTEMKAGHHAEAMAAVENAIAFSENGGERYFTSELHRLQGELLARPPCGDGRKAEESFRTAIKLAQRQGAKALERKAKASLRRWSR